MKRTVFKNARIVTPNRVVKGDVLAQDGKIADIGTVQAAGAEVIDVGGLYLSPGFIDLHNHGRLGVAAMDGEESSLEKIAGAQLAHGVTGFLAGTSTGRWDAVIKATETIAAYCEKSHPNAAQCYGIYSEGNFLSPEKSGGHPAEYLRPVSLDEFRELYEAARGTLKVMALAAELPGALPAVRWLRERGVVAAAAHSNASFAQAARAIDAGVTMATHTFNAMRPFTHQDPAVVGASLLDDRVTCEVIADGIHLHPAILEMILRAKGADRTVLVSDSVRINGIPNGAYTLDGRPFTVNDGAFRLEDGRLSGTTLSLDIAVRNMMRFGGASLCQAVHMASLVPARLLGKQASKGSIEVGKDADMVLFDDNIHIRDVVIGGAVCKIPTLEFAMRGISALQGGA